MGCSASVENKNNGQGSMTKVNPDNGDAKQQQQQQQNDEQVVVVDPATESPRRKGSVKTHSILSNNPREQTLQENLCRTETHNDIRTVYDLSLSKTNSGKILGTGMSGAVRQIRRKSDGKMFALKSITNVQQMKEKDLADLQNEINILRRMDHPHIAKLYETYEEVNTIHMVLELCEGGELFDRLMTKCSFRERQTAQIVLQQLSALEYLHVNNVVHRDLKLENWLFRSKNDESEIVLIDFGLSHKYKKSEHMHSKVGTSYYIAPEVLHGDYTSACDMWSLGVITFMLLSGTAPFGGENDDQILRNVLKHKYSMSGSVWNSISSDAKDFVCKLLEVDPSKRLTAQQALKHKWITKVDHANDDIEIDEKTLQNLKNFKNFHQLKRVAMEMVAFQLDHEEIKNLTKLFEAINKKHDGYVTFSELKEALQKHKNISDKDCKEIFDAIDEEHTGLVHINEFVAATLQEKYYMDEQYLHDTFFKIDTEHTGFITTENLRDLLGKDNEHTEVLLKEAFETLHITEDNKISYKAFLQFMREDGHSKVNAHINEQTPL